MELRRLGARDRKAIFVARLDELLDITAHGDRQLLGKVNELAAAVAQDKDGIELAERLGRAVIACGIEGPARISFIENVTNWLGAENLSGSLTGIAGISAALGKMNGKEEAAAVGSYRESPEIAAGIANFIFDTYVMDHGAASDPEVKDILAMCGRSSAKAVVHMFLDGGVTEDKFIALVNTMRAITEVDSLPGGNRWRQELIVTVLEYGKAPMVAGEVMSNILYFIEENTDRGNAGDPLYSVVRNGQMRAEFEEILRGMVDAGRDPFAVALMHYSDLPAAAGILHTACSNVLSDIDDDYEVWEGLSWKLAIEIASDPLSTALREMAKVLDEGEFRYRGQQLAEGFICARGIGEMEGLGRIDEATDRLLGLMVKYKGIPDAMDDIQEVLNGVDCNSTAHRAIRFCDMLERSLVQETRDRFSDKQEVFDAVTGYITAAAYRDMTSGGTELGKALEAIGSLAGKPKEIYDFAMSERSRLCAKRDVQYSDEIAAGGEGSGLYEGRYGIQTPSLN